MLFNYVAIAMKDGTICTERCILEGGNIHFNYVKFEVFTAVTMKNGVLWDVTPCGSCKNRRFGGT
jgi:cytidine deaminase